jgi:hypothetical protein
MWTRLASHPWAYPALEVLHLVGVALLFGGLVVFELRLLGLARALDLRALARLVLPLALLGFALCAFSGLCMFATQPQELLANPAFRFKLVLLALAGANAAWFHARGSLALGDRPARAQGLLSLGIWLAVIICGRWIAYV